MAGNYTHMAALGTLVIASHPSILRGININTKGATANTLTLFDNAGAASGAIVAVIDTTAGPASYYFGSTGAQLDNGLTAVMATGTAADVTFIFD